MRVALSFCLLSLSLAAFGDDQRSGAHKMDRVGEIDWMQADEIALPPPEFGGNNSAKGGAGGGVDTFSYRKERAGGASAIAGGAGGRPEAAAKENDAGGDKGKEDVDTNKLSWRASSTALVDGKAQLVQFGYDDGGAIKAVKFADNDTPVVTSLDGTFPNRLRSVNGNVSQKIGGREVTSLKSESQRCAG